MNSQAPELRERKTVITPFDCPRDNAELLAPDEVAVDPLQVLGRARQATPDPSHFDLQLYLPDGRILVGTLEDAPARRIAFDIDNPPDWLRWG